MEKSGSYPSFFSRGPIVPPIAAAAAAPEPLIAPKSMFATTFVCAKADGIRPLKTLAQLTRRMAIPPLFIIFPAKIKKGIAISENEFEPAKSLCADVVKAIYPGSIHIMDIAEESPMLTPMGTPMANKIINNIAITMAT